MVLFAAQKILLAACFQKLHFWNTVLVESVLQEPVAMLATF